MRKFFKNNHADMDMILTAVIMAILFAISIIIVFNVHSALSDDLSTLDAGLETARGDPAGTSTAATNASNSILTNIETFYTIGPILLIVVAAVGILGYVLLLRRKD